MIFRLAEAGDKGRQLGRRQMLIPQHDRAEVMECVDHRGQGGVIGHLDVHIQDLGAKAFAEWSGSKV